MKIHILNGLNNMNLFFTHFWRLGSPSSVYHLLSSWLADDYVILLTWPLLVNVQRERESKLSVCLHIGTLTVSELGSHT